MVLPLAIDLAGLRCLFVGGGRVVARRLPLLLAAGANVTVIAPEVHPSVSEHAASGRATHVQRAFQAGDTDDAFLTIAATNDPDVNRAVAGEVLARNGLVSVATNPQQGNCSFMATVRRGPLTVGVHSGGAGPHVAIAIRAVVESALPENIEAVLDELSAIRAELRAKVPDAAERGRLWQAVARSGELENALSKGSRESLDSVRGLLNIRRP